MITKKTLSLRTIYEFAGHHLIWLTPWMASIATLYYFTHWQLFTIPWLPLSLIGVSVAFYVGFKNNQSYDRLWEGRKIWGSIINNSRMLSTMIKQLKSVDQAETSTTEQLRRKLVYRHIAFIYQLRTQLLEPMQWEHVKLSMLIGHYNKKRQDRILASFEQELTQVANRKYLNEEEKANLEQFNNKAVQLLDQQSAVVQQLYQMNAINTMQQIELQRTINSFYEEQGKAERIKRFPFPRQYGSFSFVFVCIFVFLLPFGIVGEFAKLGNDMIWLSIPLGVIVGWVYVVMEMIGDYSENPFEGLFNDIPMLSICRTIEIDLLQMIGAEQVPNPIVAKNNILI